MANYHYKIKKIYPIAIDNEDFSLQDNSDGQGVFIKKWNTLKLGPEPSLADLDGQISDQAAQDAINAFPYKKTADIAALGTRADLLLEIEAMVGASPQVKAMMKKLAEIVYSNEKGTID